MAMSVTESPLAGGIFVRRKLLVGGMWWARVIHAGTPYHRYWLIKQSKHMIKMEDIVSGQYELLSLVFTLKSKKKTKKNIMP